jgi:hypothetical protein
MWMLGWLLPLAGVIAVGLGASADSRPASDPSTTPGAGAAISADSGPAGGSSTTLGTGAAATLSQPASESQPGVEDEGEEGPESQPATGPGASTMPSSGPGSRPARGGGAYSRPAGSTGASGTSPFGRTRGRDRTGDRGGTRGGAGAAPASPPVFGPSTSWDAFSVVATRNIFIKDRSVRDRTPSFVMPTAPPPPVTGLILTGIALVQDGNAQSAERVAFLEDSGTGKPVRASAGGVLEGGRVVEVTIDGIQYEKGGVRRWVPLGQALSGGRLDLASQPTAGATETVGGTSASGPSTGGGSGGGGGDSVLERLKRRRQQEMR